jgi:hypothetical protein
MSINQLSTSNTFQQWLIATQVLIERSNYYEDRTNLVFDTANAVSNTANAVSNTASLVFASANVVNAQTTIVLSTASNVAILLGNTITFVSDSSNTANTIVLNALNTSNIITSNALDTSNTITSNALNTSIIIVNSANSFANLVNVTAQNAYDTANASLLVSQNAANLIYVVLDDTTTNTTLFPALFVSNTGTPNTAYVSSEKLYYNPSTGQLSATNFDSLSDINKKTDIETIQNAVELVMMLRGVTFNWKDNGYKSMGLIAQEVETVIPEVVITNDRGEKSVTYGSLIGLMVEAIKELNSHVVEIKNKINK